METIRQQLNSNAEQLKNLRVGQSLSIKAAGTMLESTNVTGEGMEGIVPQLLEYIPIKPSYQNSQLDYFPKVQVDSATVVVTNEVSDDGTVGKTTEGTAKAQIDKDDNAARLTLNKYTAYVKISREMLTDIRFMNDQINRVLTRRLKNKISAEFFAAITAATPTYDAGDLTAGTTGTAVKDCIPAIYADMQRVSNYDMNLWMLDQPDYAKLFNEAGQNYLWYGLNNPTILNNAAVAAGYIVGLNTDMFPLYVYKDINIQIGYENTDFTKNLVTIRGEARVGWNIGTNALSAIYNDTISATLAAIL